LDIEHLGTDGTEDFSALHPAVISEFFDIKDIQKKERRRGHLDCGRGPPTSELKLGIP